MCAFTAGYSGLVLTIVTPFFQHLVSYTVSADDDDGMSLTGSILGEGGGSGDDDMNVDAEFIGGLINRGRKAHDDARDELEKILGRSPNKQLTQQDLVARKYSSKLAKQTAKQKRSRDGLGKRPSDDATGLGFSALSEDILLLVQKLPEATRNSIMAQPAEDQTKLVELYLNEQFKRLTILQQVTVKQEGSEMGKLIKMLEIFESLGWELEVLTIGN